MRWRVVLGICIVAVVVACLAVALSLNRHADAPVENVGGGESEIVFINPVQENYIVAPYSGRVENVVFKKDFGFAVTINHGAGLKSVLSGITDLLVSLNDNVSAGQIIGYSSEYFMFEIL